MRGLQKSKRVSWPPDVNLCQVRLFLSEESPSLVGLGVQDHLQAKASWLPHSNVAAADDVLPPGFEGGHPANVLQIKLSEVPVIKWRCPPRLAVDLTWQVVAGEESKEVEAQNQREMRMLEAVYPRPSAIPPNPTVSTDIENPQLSDSQIPLIPIIPIEDEDTADTTSDLMGSYNISVSAQPQVLAPGIPPQVGIPNMSNTPVNEKPAGGVHLGAEPEVMAAASAALAAINKSNEDMISIDPDLLMKILNNPELIGQLVNGYGVAANAQKNMPVSDAPPPVALANPSNLHTNRIESNLPSSLPAISIGSFYAQPNGVGHITRPNPQVPPTGVPASSTAPPSIGAPQVKDVNYYKSLIQQHGGERQEAPQQYGNRYNQQTGTNQEMFNPKSRDSKPKVMKPCIYFNSSKGCRNGANCVYQHDRSSQQKSSFSISEVQTAKRMKMDREISS